MISFDQKIGMRLIYVLLILFSFTSCALDGIFLHPNELSKDDQFSQYSEEKKDTLTMGFVNDFQPEVTRSTGELVDLPYELDALFFKNQYGDSINGWFFKPKENYNGTTIYFLHGNAGHIVWQYSFVTPFVKAGFQVFIIDYSGFGFSQGEASRKAVYRDATDGLNYLLNREDIKYDHLLIYGQSLGGHLSAVIASENQDKIDGLIMEGAFSSHKDIASDRVPVLGRIFTREMYSAEKSLPKLEKPLLIIHSTEDETIPFEHGEHLFDVASEPKEFYVIDKPHIRGPLYYADSIVAKMNRMIQK